MKAWLIRFIGIFIVCGVAVVPIPAVNHVLHKSESNDDIEALTRSVYPFHPSVVSLGPADRYSPPDFTVYTDTLEKKEAFYSYLLPMIHAANKEVIKERQWLTAMGNILLMGQKLSESERAELGKFEVRYAGNNTIFQAFNRGVLSDAERVGELLLRVDVVPASLIVAQAAKESGWGTSRFAREGNNFFGIWCFNQGCGITPLRRDIGRGHEVATFGSVEQGVRYYVRTINTHIAYNGLRKVRADAKRMQKVILGEQLADGLLRYSERGMAYVREIQSMIRFNKMQRFTRQYSA